MDRARDTDWDRDRDRDRLGIGIRIVMSWRDRGGPGLLEGYSVGIY
jgi:hypothetical protein